MVIKVLVCELILFQIYTTSNMIYNKNFLASFYFVQINN